MKLLFMPYRMASQSAKELATHTDAKRSKGTKRIKRGTLVCNWGRSDLVVRGRPYKVLNSSDKIIQATNKLSCLNKLRQYNVSSVEHTTDIRQVALWLAEPDMVVYGRSLLNASQGKGIVLIKQGDVIPWCPLYTKGIAKAREFRVHVFGDKVIDVTQKKRRNGTEVGSYIKNLANGWVYCREGIIVPDNLTKTATDAVAALQLDFGAVDLLYRRNQPYVLEINTAPGLQGKTLQAYVNEFNKLKGML